MDAKSIKEKLKSAREAINSKQFEEAVKICKGIQAADKTNYNALVFEGAALEGLQQPTLALIAYRKAVALDGTQGLAWQGICRVYENSPPADSQSRSELIQAYENQLQAVKSNEKKCYDTGVKLAELCLSECQLQKAISLCDELMSSKLWNELQGLPVYRIFALALSKSGDVPEERKDKCVMACRVVIACPNYSAEERLLCVHTFFKLTADVTLLWNICCETAQCHDDLFSIETLCHIWLDHFVDCGVMLDLDNHLDKLATLSADSSWLKVITDVKMNATLLLNQDVKDLNNVASWKLITAQRLLQCHSWKATCDTVNDACKLLANKATFYGDVNKLRETLLLVKAKALVESSLKTNWNLAVDTVGEFASSRLVSEVDVNVCKAKALLRLGEIDAALQISSCLLEKTKCTDTLILDGLCKLVRSDLDGAESSFKEVLEMDSSSAFAHHGLGLVYWHMLKKSNDMKSAMECLRHLILAAKQDPYFSETFLYLGQYYEQINKDLQKAKRCYQKAYELDRDLPEAGSSLVGCLMALNERDAAAQCLRSVIDKSNSSQSMKWAWLRLGLYQMKYEDVTSAIASLQTALRLDPTDSHCWECIGEAYMNRGSYTTAMKAFTKALELNHSSVYCSYQIANIKLKLGLFTEAVNQYGSVLQLTPEYVPALQGHGTAHLHLARCKLDQCLHGRAVIHCQQAISSLTQAAKLKPDLSCIWKNLGDACVVLHNVPASVARLNVPKVLLSSENCQEGESTVNLAKKDLLALGSRCYATALKLRPTLASLWHDLGVSYYYEAKNSEGIVAMDLAQKSLETLKKSVTMDQSSFVYWNALGVVAASKEILDRRLAQHCFIKSVELESNNVSAWTNLGVLYLVNDHVELAHEAFKIAQSLDPNYVNCWIGQALIAEKVGENREAMDLFRHTTELGFHAEGLIGYAHWVGKTIQDKSHANTTWYQYAVVQMGAVIAACDSLEKYLDHDPDNAVAWNMLGILLECQKLYKPALRAQSRCMQLLETVGKNPEMLLSARRNYARLLCSNQRFEEAIQQYNILLEHCKFEAHCGLGLSMFKSRQFDSGASAYKKALTMSDEKDSPLLLVALAMCAYASGSTDAAKEDLYKQVTSSKRQSPDALKALLCLGLIERDGTLTEMVVEKYRQLPGCAAQSDLAYLLAYSKLLQGDSDGAVSLLASEIHRRPDITVRWIQLAQFLLQNLASQYETCIVHCSNVAMAGNTAARKAGLQCSSLLEYVSQQQSRESCQNAFQTAKKLVHLFPEDVSSWCLLLATSHQESIQRKLSDSPHFDVEAFTQQYATHILTRVESELTHGGSAGVLRQTLQSLHMWCAQQYTLSLIAAQKMSQAKHFLEQAIWLYDEDDIMKWLAAVLERDVESIQQQSESADGAALQVLSQLKLAVYLLLGKSSEAHGEYQLWKDECRYGAAKLLLPLVEQQM